MSPADVVQRQVETYNAQDLNAFCKCFAEDCVIADLNGAVTQSGLAQIRERYRALFAQYPGNRAEVVHRMTVGDVVIDHEIVERSPELRIEAIAIYTVRDGLISRVDFVRET
jgi:uncharacterized protein (TIGR02246 family)